MHTTFVLPLGAIIEIAGRRYEYLGDSRLIGLTDNDIPVIVEAVVHHRGCGIGTIKTEEVDYPHICNERVVFFCEPL